MSKKVLSGEDQLDANYRLVAIVFLCIGLVSATGATQFLVPAGSAMTQVVSMLHNGFLVVAPLLCIYVVWRGVMSRAKACAAQPLVGGGFVFHSIRKAAVIAALVTYASLAFMHELSDDTTLPVKFYLNLAMAIMTLTFSATYLMTSRVGPDDGDTGLE